LVAYCREHLLDGDADSFDQMPDRRRRTARDAAGERSGMLVGSDDAQSGTK
jgi:hypothetical protein